ncbi:hypothetical protein ACQJBY_050318 [Aegilops geniculata]|nr:uncharacterized protein LOC123187155 isoform X2 [Triticum aestivum]
MYYMQKMFIQDIFPSWLYVCCTYMPTSSTAKSSYRWGYRGCQDGQRIGIEFAELARTDHDLVTFAIEGTVYLWSPVDLMTLATATANATAAKFLKLDRHLLSVANYSNISQNGKSKREM